MIEVPSSLLGCYFEKLGLTIFKYFLGTKKIICTLLCTNNYFVCFYHLFDRIEKKFCFRLSDRRKLYLFTHSIIKTLCVPVCKLRHRI